MNTHIPAPPTRVLTRYVLPVALVAAATFAPVVKREGYFPKPVQALAEGAMPLVGEVFTPVAERVNGRAAMVGIAALLALSAVF